MFPHRKVGAIRERQRIQQKVKNIMSPDHLHIVRVLGYCLEKKRSADSLCALLVPVGDNKFGYFLHEECDPASSKQ